MSEENGQLVEEVEAEAKLETKTLEGKIGVMTIDKKFMVRDEKDLAIASEIRFEGKRRIKVIEEKLEAPKKKSRAAWQAIVDLEKELLDPFKKMIEFVDEGTKAYLAEEERKRQEAAEKAATADEAARLAAEKAEETGDVKDIRKAERLEEKADQAAVAVSTSAPKAAGLGARKIYKVEILNADLVPREYCIPDEAKIRKLAAIQGLSLKIPGVKIIEDFSLTSR